MMKKFCLIAVALMSLLGSSCALASNNDVIRYKMTVTVSTPEGDRSGSAVREALILHRELAGSKGTVDLYRMRGEAIVVDLGKRGVLFAVTDMNEEPGDIFRILKDKQKNEPVTMTLEQLRHYSRFVSFKDLNNPETIQRAARLKIEGGQPAGPNTDIWMGGQVKGVNLDENIFGKGVIFKSVTVALTDEPITTGIEKWLPWLPQKTGPGYLGSTTQRPFTDPSGTYLTSIAFNVGVKYGQ